MDETKESAPQRIQRKRAAGWRKPENAICITRPGKYGNPYKIGAVYQSPFVRGGAFLITSQNVLGVFEIYARSKLAMDPNWLEPLRGKDLCCFCKLDAPCHGDIILKLLRETEK